MPGPAYWVAPRHLAGDDDTLVERIDDAFVDLGWRMWPTARHTLLYVSNNGLCGGRRMGPCGLPVAPVDSTAAALRLLG